MQFLKIFLPIGAFTLSFVIYQISKRKLICTQKDLLVSSALILAYSVFILICNLGFVKFSLGLAENNLIFVAIITLNAFILLLKKYYYFPFAIALAMFIYLLQIYNNADFTLYLVDFATLFIYLPWTIILIYKYAKK